LPGAGQATRGKVAWLTTEEDPAREVRARLLAAGGDAEGVLLPELGERHARGTHWDFPAREAELIELVRGHGVRLVVFDPITSYVPPTELPDSGRAARMVMDCLARVGEATGAALLTIKHPRKGGSGGEHEQVSGSMEWVNCPRSVLVCQESAHEPDVYVLLPLRVKLSGKPPGLRYRLVEAGDSIKVEWGEETALTARQLFQARGDAAFRSGQAQAIAFLKAKLEEGPQTISDLRRQGEQEALSPDMLRRAADILAIEQYRVGFGPGSVYRWRRPAGGWPK
jgi:hypothetical protein